MENKRPSKKDYYLGIAEAVSKRSTCLRRKIGAIIVRDDQIISTGYAGSPRGALNCIDIGECAREKFNVPKGERYELCRSVHAEANAIINAARAGVSALGGTLYLYGENADGSLVQDFKPCQMCRRMIVNCGLEKVIVRAKDGTKEFNPQDWLQELISVNGY